MLITRGESDAALTPVWDTAAARHAGPAAALSSPRLPKKLLPPGVAAPIIALDPHVFERAPCFPLQHETPSARWSSAAASPAGAAMTRKAGKTSPCKHPSEGSSTLRGTTESWQQPGDFLLAPF